MYVHKMKWTKDTFRMQNIIDIFLGQGFIDEVKKLDASKNYYVYCRSGGRSGQACAIMNSIGFENAYNLMGGFMEWEGEKTN